MIKQNSFLFSALILILLPLIFHNKLEVVPPANPPTVEEKNSMPVSISTESSWQAEESAMLNGILEATIGLLDEMGFDGRSLLSGYEFRRHSGEYISEDAAGEENRIAVVNHEQQVVTLADAAFKRLHGFYIIHELGHIVDHRTGRQLSAAFHSLAGSDRETGKTAAGYWLNLHAESDLEEATADAFALWVMAGYEPGYKPIFAFTPVTADYAGITTLMAGSLDSLHLN
jgi:hypothetical protein